MRLQTSLVWPALFLLALLSTCKTTPLTPNGTATPPPSSRVSLKLTAPKRLVVRTEKEVTFYPTYGFRDEKGWNIHLRGWVHKNRGLSRQLHQQTGLCENSMRQ